VLAAEAIQIQRRVVQQNTPSLHAPTANKWAALPTLLFGAWEGLELESREKRGRGELGKPDPPKKNILRFVFLYLKRASAKHLGTSFTDQSVRFQGLFRQFSQCRECSRKINVNRIDGMDAARARGEVSSRAKQKLKTDSEGVKTNKRYTNVLRQSKVNLHRDAQSHGFFLSLMTNFFFAPPTVPEVAAPTPCLANALLPVPDCCCCCFAGQPAATLAPAVADGLPELAATSSFACAADARFRSASAAWKAFAQARQAMRRSANVGDASEKYRNINSIWFEFLVPPTAEHRFEEHQEVAPRSR